MLRITQSKSASGAKKYYTEEYYREGAVRGDYYSEKDQVIGNDTTDEGVLFVGRIGLGGIIEFT